MKYLKYTFQISLLIILMSFMGILVVWVLENIFKMGYNNIIHSGIKVGVMSSIILILMEIYSKNNKQ